MALNNADTGADPGAPASRLGTTKFGLKFRKKNRKTFVRYLDQLQHVLEGLFGHSIKLLFSPLSTSKVIYSITFLLAMKGIINIISSEDIMNYKLARATKSVL